VLQTDLTRYRSSGDLPNGAVLVGGSGASGCQIANELLHAGRSVYLSVSRHWRAPRRLRGKDVYWWLDKMGRFAQTIGAFRARGVFSGGLWWEHRRCWQAITVRHSRGSWERVDLRGGCLVVTEAARDAIRRLCRETGRQALLLSWPGGAVCLPSSLYAPSAFDVIIGHVARCPIFVDLRRLGFPAGARVVLDATHGWPRRPLLRLRPAGRREPARRPRAATKPE
jgi:hypothetical protein